MLARGSRRAAAEALALTGGNVVAPSLLTALAIRSSILNSRPQQHRGPSVLRWSMPEAHGRTGFVSTPFASAARAAAVKAAPVDDPEPEPVSDEPKAAKPFTDIEGLVSPRIYDALVGKPFRFTTMSAVQEAVLELLPDLADPVRPDEARSGTDLLVKAKTGTGKTLAFLVPALEARLRDIQAVGDKFRQENPDASPAELRRHVDAYRRKTTGVLILSPTRELATQIAQEAVRLCYHLRDLDVRLFVGGASKGFQLREWGRGGRDIVVATPGRMTDVLDSEPEVARHAGTVKTLVLDEADTLLEMGFRDEIDRIVARLPPKEDRQTFLFSATVSREIRSVANATMKKGRKFIDCVPEGESNVHEHVPQRCTVLASPADQLPHVFRLLAHDQLSHPQGGKAIVFLPTTRLTQLFSQVLVRMKRELPWGQATRVYEIHGDRSQQQRTSASDAFRQQKDGYSILVTSDVSARGHSPFDHAWTRLTGYTQASTTPA